jgi:hypothetical protein
MTGFDPARLAEAVRAARADLAGAGGRFDVDQVAGVLDMFPGAQLVEPDVSPGERCARVDPLALVAFDLGCLVGGDELRRLEQLHERARNRQFRCERCERTWTGLACPYLWVGAKGAVLSARCPCCAEQITEQKESTERHGSFSPQAEVLRAETIGVEHQRANVKHAR